jgi:import inner membrane translocase subunit TIM17
LGWHGEFGVITLESLWHGKLTHTQFSTFDCAIKGIRKTEDPWNSIIAGFFTGGALAVRGGVKAARNSAIMCAVFLGVIEGVGIGFQRMMADNTKLELPPAPPSEQKALA